MITDILPIERVLKLYQRRGEALKVNISAGEGLQDVLKSNLGPTGTIKMYERLNFKRYSLADSIAGWCLVRALYVRLQL